MTHIVALLALGIVFVSNRIKDGMENTVAINQDAQTRSLALKAAEKKQNFRHSFAYIHYTGNEIN
jgi:hypothetical protein